MKMKTKLVVPAEMTFLKEMIVLHIAQTWVALVLSMALLGLAAGLAHTVI